MVIRVVFMAVFALSILLGAVPVRAQEATPAPAAVDLPAWVQTWISTQEEEDLLGFAIHFADGAARISLTRC